MITTKFCTRHNSCAVVTCAKICCNLMTGNGISARRRFHRIWISGKKSLLKPAPALQIEAPPLWNPIQNLMKFESKQKPFLTWKCHLQNISYFVITSMCHTNVYHEYKQDIHYLWQLNKFHEVQTVGFSPALEPIKRWLLTFPLVARIRVNQHKSQQVIRQFNTLNTRHTSQLLILQKYQNYF